MSADTLSPDVLQTPEQVLAGFKQYVDGMGDVYDSLPNTPLNASRLVKTPEIRGYFGLSQDNLGDFYRNLKELRIHIPQIRVRSKSEYTNRLQILGMSAIAYIFKHDEIVGLKTCDAEELIEVTQQWLEMAEYPPEVREAVHPPFILKDASGELPNPYKRKTEREEEEVDESIIDRGGEMGLEKLLYLEQEFVKGKYFAALPISPKDKYDLLSIYQEKGGDITQGDQSVLAAIKYCIGVYVSLPIEKRALPLNRIAEVARNIIKKRHMVRIATIVQSLKEEREKNSDQ